jgi:hypothetical protein
MDFFNKNWDYPYKQYSFIKGGDGGMVPWGTLMLGSNSWRDFGTAHELGHSWFPNMFWLQMNLTSMDGRRTLCFQIGKNFLIRKCKPFSRKLQGLLFETDSGRATWSYMEIIVEKQTTVFLMLGNLCLFN